jgi:NAD-dependent dihydropyrimidine dehydrogenase PreA subunit
VERSLGGLSGSRGADVKVERCPSARSTGVTLTAPDGLGPQFEESRPQMTYVIAEPCIDVLDISCVSVCPVDCIHYEEGVDRKLFIDPNECIDCGACEPECPVNAIFPEDQLPAEWANYTVMDATWFTDRDAARAMVDTAKPR